MSSARSATHNMLKKRRFLIKQKKKKNSCNECNNSVERYKDFLTFELLFIFDFSRSVKSAAGVLCSLQEKCNV